MITKVTHLSLIVKNQDEALAFYTEKLGFKVHTDTMFGQMRWLTIHPANQPNFEIAIMQANSPEEEALVGKQAANYPLICVESSDIKKDFEDMKANGVEFVDEPAEQPWGVSVSAKDLYGNIVYMVQMAQQ